MSETIFIRNATPSDLELILKHRRRMFADELGCDDATLDAVEKNSAAYIERGLREGWYHGWLAVSGGRVVAGAGLIIHPWVANPSAPKHSERAYLLNVYTEPDFRHQGLARKLVEAAIGWCREQGFSALALHASSQGRPLYEKLGFEPTNEMRLKI